jgi:hypothetical protein
MSQASTKRMVWDLASGLPLASFYCDPSVLCCAIARGRAIIAGDGSGRVLFLVLGGAGWGGVWRNGDAPCPQFRDLIATEDYGKPADRPADQRQPGPFECLYWPPPLVRAVGAPLAMCDPRPRPGAAVRRAAPAARRQDRRGRSPRRWPGGAGRRRQRELPGAAVRRVALAATRRCSSAGVPAAAVARGARGNDDARHDETGHGVAVLVFPPRVRPLPARRLPR